MKPLLYSGHHSLARRIALAGCACAVALTAAACSSGGNEVASFRRENNFLGGDPMAAIGLRPRRQPRIDYDPRSPLVMPPVAELQTPKEKTDLGAAWPEDPDERAAQEEEARAEYLRTKASKENRSRALSPDELDEWARNAGMRTADPNERSSRASPILSPATLLGRRKAPPDPTVEPPRRTLTQPPEGYRKAVTDENGEVHTTSEEEKPKRRGFLSRLGF